MALKRERGSNRTTGLCKLAIEEDMTIYSIEELKLGLSQEFDTYQRFELNLSAVEEIDSAGVQLLLALRNELMKSQKELKITSVSAVTTNLMDSYQITSLFNIGENA